MNRPTIDSTPGSSAGRPETVVPNTTSSLPGVAGQQQRPGALHQGVEGQPAAAAPAPAAAPVRGVEGQRALDVPSARRGGASLGPPVVERQRGGRGEAVPAAAASSARPRAASRAGQPGEVVAVGARRRRQESAAAGRRRRAKTSPSSSGKLQPSSRRWWEVQTSRWRPRPCATRVSRISGGRSRSKPRGAVGGEQAAPAPRSSCSAGRPRQSWRPTGQRHLAAARPAAARRRPRQEPRCAARGGGRRSRCQAAAQTRRGRRRRSARRCSWSR